MVIDLNSEHDFDYRKDKDVALSIIKCRDLSMYDDMKDLYEGLLSKERISELIKNSDSVIRSAIASYNALPKEFLVLLSEDESVNVRISVAGNKNTPNHILKKLLLDKKQVATTIVFRAELSDHMLLNIFESKYRDLLVERNHLPLFMQEMLFDIGSPDIKRKFIYNHTTSGIILEKLWNDESVTEKVNIISNANITEELLRKFYLTAETDVLKGHIGLRDFCPLDLKISVIQDCGSGQKTNRPSSYEVIRYQVKKKAETNFDDLSADEKRLYLKNIHLFQE